MSYVLHLTVVLAIYIIVAVSLNLAVGYCGLLSLAHAGFFAVGAYVYAVVTLRLDWGFAGAVSIAILLNVLLSLGLSLPAWRLRGDFFVLVAVAFQALIFSILSNWSAAGHPVGTIQNLTNGPLGIPGIPSISLFGFALDGQTEFALFAAVAATLCVAIVWRLTASPWGRVLIAMRDDDLAARGLGKRTRTATVQALATSAGIAAVAGALYAAHVQFIDPSSASLDASILMLSMVIVGGVGNTLGPIVGAVVLVSLPELLRLLTVSDSYVANVRLALYGLLLVLLIRFRPQGIAGRFRLD